MERKFEFPQTAVGIVKFLICGEKLDVVDGVYLHPVKILRTLEFEPCAFSGRIFKFEHFKNIIEGFEQLSRMNVQAGLPVSMRNVDPKV